jgi:serine/threonine protein phosphatase PrpC
MTAARKRWHRTFTSAFVEPFRVTTLDIGRCVGDGGAMGDRPFHFAPGTLLGRRYQVEGLVRMAEGRYFYFLHDDRPDQPRRACGTCGSVESPRSARVCHACGAALTVRRFLMTARWDASGFAPFEAYAQLALEHPGVASPVDVFRQDDQLCAVYPYRNEGLMLDEASPLANHRLLVLAQRVLGAVMALAQQGVVIGPVTRGNLLLSPHGAVRLFDPAVVDVLAGPVPPLQLQPVLASLGELLASYTHIGAPDLTAVFLAATEGGYTTGLELGRALERAIDTFGARTLPAVVAAMSDVGLARQLNEDAWRWTTLAPGLELYVLADGMGGHEAGEVASRVAVDTLVALARTEASASRERWDALPAPARADLLESRLERWFVDANNAVKDEAERRGTDMGTTLVALLIDRGQHAYIAHVGDSRAYLARAGALHPLTIDHSYVQKLVERGKIKPEDARTHPQSNILLRTVGTDRDVEVELARLDLYAGDRLLLCSDGLWGEMESEVLARLLIQTPDLRASVRELVRASHAGGGRDNCTVVAVSVV